MTEKILVCVNNMESAEALIKRGKIIATAFGTNCTVLNIENDDYDEYDFDSYEHQRLLKNICEEQDCSFHFAAKKNFRVSEVISSIAKEHGITQIIIGQPIRSKWEILTKGSLINDLFEELEGVDIHIVEVHKNKMNSVDDIYEKGTNAFLTFDGEVFQMTGSSTDDYDYKGIFYQQKATDFQNGVFKTKQNGKDYLIRILHGTANPIEVQVLKKEI